MRCPSILSLLDNPDIQVGLEVPGMVPLDIRVQKFCPLIHLVIRGRCPLVTEKSVKTGSLVKARTVVGMCSERAGSGG